jgi:hypothetical protein
LKVRPVITGLFAGLLFGLATPLSKILLSEMNSFELAGLLYFGAAVAFLPFVINHRKVELNAIRLTGKKLQFGGVILFGGILHHNHNHGENFDKSLRHSHLHEHGEITHSHKHYPDLHHRHKH